MQLAPVGAPTVGHHDRLDGPEVPLPRGTPVHVHRDVAGGAAVGGGEGDVVAGDGAHLDGEHRGTARAVDPAAHLRQRRHGGLEGDGVLHLHEAHAAGRGEHAVRPVVVLEATRARHHPGDLRGERRPAGGRPVGRLECPGAQHRVDPPLLPTAERGEGLVVAAVALGERPAGVGHPEELEVVVVGHQVVERLGHLVEAAGLLDGVQVERGHHLQGDARHDPQRAHAHAGHPQHLGVVGPVAVEHVARAGDDPHAHDPRGEVAEPAAGAVGGGGSGAGEGLRVDVAEVLDGEATGPQVLRQGVELRAGLHGDSAGARLVGGGAHLQHPAVVGQRHQHAVGDGDVAEGVRGADGLHVPAVGGGPGHDVAQLHLGGGCRHLDERPLVARPVPPELAHLVCPAMSSPVMRSLRECERPPAWAGGRSSSRLCGSRVSAVLEGLDEGRQDLVHVAHDAEVGHREDRRLGILVDGDDVLRALHAHQVLGGAGDARGDVHRRLHDLAGLAHLVRVGHPAGVDDGARGAGGGAEQLGQGLDHLVLVLLAEAAAPGDDHGGVVERRAGLLLDEAVGDHGGAGGARVGRQRAPRWPPRHRGGLRRGERLGAHQEDVDLVGGEPGDDVGAAAEDGLDTGEAAVALDEVDHVGDHGGVDLHRQAAGHVAAVVAGGDEDGVGPGARGHGAGDGAGHDRADELAVGAAHGEHLGSAVRAQLGGDVRAGGGDALDGVGELTGLGEDLEGGGADLAVGGLGEHPDLGNCHCSVLLSRGCVR